MCISFSAISSLSLLVLYSPFGQNCFRYEGNDLSSQILQSCRFSVKKRMETVLSQWLAHLKHCDLKNTIENTHICKNGNKQTNKMMGDYKPRMLLKAIWVICLFQRQLLGLRSAAVESSIAYSLKRKKTFWSEETVDLMHQVFQVAGNSTSALPSAFIN